MKTKYGYIITACAFLLMFINVGFPSTSFGVYQPYIVDTPGMNHAYGSIVLTARNLSSLITIFFVAFYYKKLDCKIGITLATLFTAFGFFLFSISSDVIMFSVSAIVAGIGYGFGGSAAMTILIGDWFENKTGTAIGIATVGSSVAGVLIPILVFSIVETWGIAESFFIQAVIALVFGILLFIFVKNNSNKKQIEIAKNKLKTHNHKLPKWKYWLFVFGVFLVGGACLSDIYFLSILFSSSGSSALLAAAVVTTANISLCVGKFVLGILFDKFGTLKGSIFAYVVIFSGTILLIIVPSNAEFLAYIASAIFGFGAAITTVGISQWSLDISTEESRKSTVRDFQAAYAAGGFITAMLPGFIAESFGTYIPFYIASAVVIVISACIFIKLYPKS